METIGEFGTALSFTRYRLCCKLLHRSSMLEQMGSSSVVQIA